MKYLKKILKVFLIILVVLLILVLGYFEIYYHAEVGMKKYIESGENVQVSKIKQGYFFDGKGENTALIFYPGAKVESKAYAKLMYELAKEGIDCFLLDVPFRFAFLGKGMPNKIIENYNYENWCVSGHSLGGVVASLYAVENSEKINSIVLLASYPTKKISDNTKLLSIYGEKDGVLKKESYENSKDKWPQNSKEVIIKGGNHAYFGNYGKQKGDNEAEISSDEQQKETIKEIIEYIK